MKNYLHVLIHISNNKGKMNKVDSKFFFGPAKALLSGTLNLSKDKKMPAVLWLWSGFWTRSHAPNFFPFFSPGYALPVVG